MLIGIVFLKLISS